MKKNIRNILFIIGLATFLIGVGFAVYIQPQPLHSFDIQHGGTETCYSCHGSQFAETGASLVIHDPIFTPSAQTVDAEVSRSVNVGSETRPFPLEHMQRRGYVVQIIDP